MQVLAISPGTMSATSSRRVIYLNSQFGMILLLPGFRYSVFKRIKINSGESER